MNFLIGMFLSYFLEQSGDGESIQDIGLFIYVCLLCISVLQGSETFLSIRAQSKFKSYWERTKRNFHKSLK